ncbi:MAG: FIST C-terminal domain-containing protein [Myxococcales bacterium]|nr:FIST C-terminal domain-containing protein [Myxococcales bacterium]MCB9734866.1 FIST C-terminal domain-containing protein [Deltaproteobacteria bacterium]
MLHVTIGHSDAIDLEDALEEIFAQTRAADARGAVGAAIVLSSMGYDRDAVLGAVSDRYPGIEVVGGTSNGTFSNRGYMEDGILVAFLGGTGVDFRVATAVGMRASVGDCGRAVVAALLAGSERAPAAIIVFADPLAGDMDRMIYAMNQALGDDPPPVYGGTTTDEWHFDTTYQFDGRRSFTDGVVALALYGDVTTRCGVQSGWIPVGQRMVITNATGPIVSTIDHRPAVDVFKEQFGDIVTTGMVEHPMAIFPDPANDADFYLRTVLLVNEREGSITAAGRVPEGAVVRLTTASAEGVLSGAAASTRDALAASPDPVDFLFVVSCAARQTVLGAHAPRERETIAAQLAAQGLGDVPFIGFYSYGEIGAPGLAAARFHNETCIAVAIGHADATRRG